MTLPRFVFRYASRAGACPRRQRNEYTPVTIFRKRKKYVIARSEATWQSPGGRLDFQSGGMNGTGPYRVLWVIGKCDLVPGDCHVASLLAMTWVSEHCKKNGTVSKPERYGGGTPPPYGVRAGRGTRPLRCWWTKIGRVKPVPYSLYFAPRP